MLRKLQWVVLLAIAALLALPAAAQEATARVRFVNVIPGASSLDVYVDGLRAVAGLEYGAASLYIPITEGVHTITATQADVTTALWQQDVTLNPSTAVTMIASSTDPLGFQPFQDDLNPLPLGKTRVTAVHAIAGGPTVDITLADGRALIPGLQYNTPYGTLDVPAAVYEIAVIPAGETLESAIIPVTPVALNSGTSTMVVAFGTPVEPGVLVLSAATNAEDSDAGNRRFVHAVEGAPAVDVYVNDTLIAPSLEFGRSTAFIALPAGEHSASVRLTGETTDLASQEFSVDADSYATLAVLGNAEELAIASLEDDVSAASPTQAVVAVSNQLADGAVSVSFAGDTIIDAVSVSDSAGAAVAPSLGELSLTTDTGATIGGGEAVLYGGVYYAWLAFNGEGGPQAISLPAESIAMSIESAPGDARLATAVPTEAPTTAPAEATPLPAETVAAAPTEAAVQPTAAPAVDAGPTTGVTARVLTDPGVNIHLRQFPSSQALSLILIPSGTVLQVQGRPGEFVFPAGVTVTPDPSATPFVDPATVLTEEDTDLDPAATWLFVTYNTPDGGSFTGWVNALYLAVTDENGEPQVLAQLPLIPGNRAGQPNTAFVPTPIPTIQFEDQVVATVDQLAPGANLHLRRNPSTAAESLALIPAGTQLVVNGRLDTGEWYQVEYEGISGWISATYVSLTLNGRTLDPTTVPVLATPTPTPTVEPTAAA